MDILAATFCGIYAGNISGTNLLTTLSNYPDISRGGSYGAILALLAADSNEYSLPADGINTRATLRSVILSAQNEDGGFCLTKGEESSPFLTACALTALSRYSSMDEVRQAVQEGFPICHRSNRQTKFCRNGRIFQRTHNRSSFNGFMRCRDFTGQC